MQLHDLFRSRAARAKATLESKYFQIKSNQTLFSNLYKYKHVIHDEIYIYTFSHRLDPVKKNFVPDLGYRTRLGDSSLII